MLVGVGPSTRAWGNRAQAAATLPNQQDSSPSICQLPTAPQLGWAL